MLLLFYIGFHDRTNYVLVLGKFHGPRTADFFAKTGVFINFVLVSFCDNTNMVLFISITIS